MTCTVTVNQGRFRRSPFSKADAVQRQCKAIGSVHWLMTYHIDHNFFWKLRDTENNGAAK